MKIESFAEAKTAINEISNFRWIGSDHVVSILNFLVQRIEEMERGKTAKFKCMKCGAIMKFADGELSCQRCDAEEILAGEHDDALSRIVTELAHEEDVTMKRYNAEAVLAQTTRSEESQARVAMGLNPPVGRFIVVASPKDIMGQRTYLTGMPASEEMTVQSCLWGNDSVNALTFSRERAEQIAEKLHTLYGRATGSFTAIPETEQPREFFSTGTIAHGNLIEMSLGAMADPAQAQPLPQGTCCPQGEPGPKGPPGIDPSQKVYSFIFDKKPLTTIHARLTGRELRELLPDDKKHYAIYTESADQVADFGVSDTESVDTDHRTFYSVPPAIFGQEQAKKETENLLGTAVEIVVNADVETLYFKEDEPREITYEQIVRFACDQIDRSKGRPVKPPGYDQFPMMSVTYHHKVPFEQLPGERDGSLHKGEKVAVTVGMIINSYCT